MVGILNRFIHRTVSRSESDHLVTRPVRLPASLSNLEPGKRRHIEEMVILGVLLGSVAHADGNFSREEEQATVRILTRRGSISKEEAALVIAAARESKDARPDIQGFTREVAKKPYKERLEVMDLLFLVALSDQNLSHVEMESVRKIAGLLWITHKDFIKSKLRAKEKSAIRS